MSPEPLAPTELDAVLVLSFGGPEGPEQVMPFLENVTRGRGVPRERLVEVAEHYLHFGGVSPINGINRALIERLRGRVDLPVYFGNRNWEPYVEDTVAAMRDDGVRRAAVFATSAWGGYSGCVQYNEDIARARRAAGAAAPELIKLRQYYDHPLFVRMFADAVTAAAATVPAGARLVFTAHSIPQRARSRCGEDLYARQVAHACRLVAAAAGYDDYDQVWQSRSGPPQVPWLEPDVADHLAALTDSGTTAVVVCPIGFVADHIEVVWDLDHELREQAERAGIAFARAATPNADLAEVAADLIDELRAGRSPARVPAANQPPLQGFSVNGGLCTTACG
ncbi:ferrochelatase [Mycolicibacterium hassiacum DSM 44199]|uniref:Coproporphyrin III ferrochelatase n=2 Tax=Mycolicibacterium hassiacum TaxID=46351 RepID=K5BBD5_MYCHD|nr:ferrochelatase [Mycolicibacterium hassiacum]EKF23800.1 ferrochelatase [Mycolicibacterium hassiacum DSM 44199]MBX5485494.1 ferrochelatase [Mycolicibacterium hassiacum]MDA4085857.1 ferrochelatase [Mycolicibacterium hassiacum DSM 44199]PZN24846.1 MAG: ferrochelatase [Mycolicibacterium hassiacum]VCT90404.1 Ferrochelatase [Mycolicibacterium hassiacum DSM 44199]